MDYFEKILQSLDYIDDELMGISDLICHHDFLPFYWGEGVWESWYHFVEHDSVVYSLFTTFFMCSHFKFEPCIHS